MSHCCVSFFLQNISLLFGLYRSLQPYYYDSTTRTQLLFDNLMSMPHLSPDIQNSLNRYWNRCIEIVKTNARWRCPREYFQTVQPHWVLIVSWDHSLLYGRGCIKCYVCAILIDNILVYFMQRFVFVLYYSVCTIL